MSRFITISVFLFFLTGCDEEIARSQVPSIVENTFKSNFLHPQDVEWKIVNGNYQVSFEIKDVDHTALLDTAGNLVKYKHEIEESALSNIKSLLDPEREWEDIEVIIVGKVHYYQGEIAGFWTDRKVVVDSAGKLITNIKYWN